MGGACILTIPASVAARCMAQRATQATMTNHAAQSNKTWIPASGRRGNLDSLLEAMRVRAVNRAARERVAEEDTQFCWLDCGPTVVQAAVRAAIARDWRGDLREVLG